MDSQYSWRPRKPRRRFLHQDAQRAHLRAASWRLDDRRGVNFLARGKPSNLRPRPGLWSEMGHGLDARKAGIFLKGLGPSPLPSSRPYLWPALRLERKLRTSAIA